MPPAVQEPDRQAGAGLFLVSGYFANCAATAPFEGTLPFEVCSTLPYLDISPALSSDLFLPYRKVARKMPTHAEKNGQKRGA